MWDGEPLGPPMQRRLDAYDVLVRRNEAVSILDKVRAFRIGGKAEATLDCACVQPETVRAPVPTKSSAATTDDFVTLIPIGNVAKCCEMLTFARASLPPAFM